MRKIILAIGFFCLSLISVSNAFASGEMFYFDYAVVDHMIKNDSGEFKKLMDLNKLGEKVENKEAGDFLAQFWWNRCVISCHDYITSVFDSQKVRLHDEKVKKIIDMQHTQCVESYIYDNWDEINTTISNRYNYLQEKLNGKPSFWGKIKDTYGSLTDK